MKTLATLIVLAAAASAQTVPSGPGLEDLFGGSGAEECRTLDSKAPDDMPSLKRLSECLASISPDYGIYLDFPEAKGATITFWFITSANPSEYELFELGRFQANLSYSVERHLRGVYAGRAVVLKTTQISSLLEHIGYCNNLPYDSDKPMESQLGPIEACLKGSRLGIESVVFDGARIRVTSSAPAAARAAMNGLISTTPREDGMPGRPLFVESVCARNCR